MSPEHARSESIDARSDIYSLGVIVFEMLVGKRNFDTVTPLGLAFTQETNVIHRILDTIPALPPDVQTVIEKVLARDRDLRYGSSTEFVNDLVAALSVPWPPPQEEPVREETPSRARYWVAAGILLFGLILFGIWGYPGPISPPPVSTKTATATTQPTVETRTPTATSTPTETAPPPVVSTRPPGGADRIALTWGEIADSPGVRDYAPPVVPLQDVQLGFVEIAARARDCRFADCQHLREPQCAVQAAVESGAIDARRFESYRRLLNLTRQLDERRGWGS